jgi:hypothetical protein
MRSLPEALDQFAYHPGTPETAPKFGAMRDKTMAFIADTWDLIPDGPEKTLALRGLQQYLMFANLAIAMTSPADLTNQAVARVLPTEPVAQPVAQPAAGPGAQTVSCACGDVPLGPTEASYQEGGKLHRPKPGECVPV